MEGATGRKTQGRFLSWCLEQREPAGGAELGAEM